MRANRLWRGLVPVVCLTAGFGFGALARDARGTDLRASQSNLVDLVRDADTKVQAQTSTVAGLQQQVHALTVQAGAGNAAVAATQRQVDELRAPAGLTAVGGDGVAVVLDDADDSSANAGVDPNQLVVHQSDLQAVVNALWAGGAEAMSIAGQRVIATSAVRCVGNTLLLNGQVFSPPYRVEAIGASDAMVRALDASPGVALFKQAASYYGLGWTVESDAELTLPAYGTVPVLSYAHATGA